MKAILLLTAIMTTAFTSAVAYAKPTLPDLSHAEACSYQFEDFECVNSDGEEVVKTTISKQPSDYANLSLIAAMKKAGFSLKAINSGDFFIFSR